MRSVAVGRTSTASSASPSPALGAAMKATRAVTPPSSRSSTISAVDRFRVRPAWPVAQNGHAIPQPAWLEMHTVTRSG